MTTSKQMPLCVQELDKRGLSYPVLIGGAAINRPFGRRIGFVDGDSALRSRRLLLPRRLRGPGHDGSADRRERRENVHRRKRHEAARQAHERRAEGSRQSRRQPPSTERSLEGATRTRRSRAALLGLPRAGQHISRWMKCSTAWTSSRSSGCRGARTSCTAAEYQRAVDDDLMPRLRAHAGRDEAPAHSYTQGDLRLLPLPVGRQRCDRVRSVPTGARARSRASPSPASPTASTFAWPTTSLRSNSGGIDVIPLAGGDDGRPGHRGVP